MCRSFHALVRYRPVLAATPAPLPVSPRAASCPAAPSPPDGTPLRPGLLWMDMRSAEQAARVAAADDPALQVGCGVRTQAGGREGRGK